VHRIAAESAVPLRRIAGFHFTILPHVMATSGSE
jgi:hypothetical protein